MLRAALGAVTPSKPGPKPRVSDPQQAALEKQLRDLVRERELLEIKVRHLEEIQKEMVARGIGVDGGKKDAGRARPRKPGAKVSRRLQAARPEVRPGAPGARPPHPGAGAPDGARPIDALRVEEEDRDREAGPKGAGS